MGAFDFSVVKSRNKVLQDPFYNLELKLWGKKDLNVSEGVKVHVTFFFFFFNVG